MPRCMIIADPDSAADWAEALIARGLQVDVPWVESDAPLALDGAEIGTLIVEIATPDSPRGMLIAQCRARWPEATLIVVAASYGFGTSGMAAMGLWEPDVVLSPPVAPRLLVTTVQIARARRLSKELLRNPVPAVGRRAALARERSGPAED